MNKSTKAISNNMEQLTEDAHALVTATADVAGDKVREARERLAVVLERGRKMCGQVRDKAVESAKAADKTVHEHPYQAIAIGIGAGAVLGYLISRRCSRSCE